MKNDDRALYNTNIKLEVAIATISSVPDRPPTSTEEDLGAGMVVTDTDHLIDLDLSSFFFIDQLPRLRRLHPYWIFTRLYDIHF